jgi:APA family basic amino acid/polyamine antiporter
LIVGFYAWPAQAHAIAVVAVLALTTLNYTGIQKSAFAIRIIVAVVLTALATVAVVALTAPSTDFGLLDVGVDSSAHGVLQAAGMLFFAFAGYARIATLGEEVRDPARTIPRAIPLALGIALIVYAVVAVAALAVLGSRRLAHSTAPLADVMRAAGAPGFEPVVRIVAVMAALGSLLSLILGVSRTTFAMARDHYLPQQLSVVHPEFKTPYRAEVAVGVVVAVLAGTAEVPGAIGFSSFAVLVYYAIANASAWTLGGRIVPTAGFIGCLVFASALPLNSVLLGTAVLLVGTAAYAVRRNRST